MSSRRTRLTAGALLFLLTSSPALAHQGHGSTLPWDVCETLSLGDTCAFEPGHGELHVGTCRSMADDLLCVRNRPITKVRRTSPTTYAALSAIGVFGTFGALVMPVLRGGRS